MTNFTEREKKWLKAFVANMESAEGNIGKQNRGREISLKGIAKSAKKEADKK